MEIWKLPTRQIARGVRTRMFSSVEAVQSSLARIAEANGSVNALAEVQSEQALTHAREADIQVAAGGELGPLHGVPIAFKVNTNVEGLPTTDGVEGYANNMAAESDPQVVSWLGAGAVSVGRSNCPPFSMRWTTEGDLHGRTYNPWDPTVTPGGSSGGAASAVAVGMVPLAQGNDTGGSLRYPAACCGVVGLRPTKGRVPGWSGPTDHDPAMLVQAFVAQGPIGRRVDDVRIGLSAMQAPDPRDPTAVPPSAVADPPRGRAKVAVVPDPGGPGLAGASAPEAVEAVEAAAGWLEEAGYNLEEVELPALGEAASVWWKVAMTEVKLGLGDEIRRAGDERTRRFFELVFATYEREFGEVDLLQFILGYHRQGGLRREVSTFMDEYRLILTPSSGEAPFPLDDDVVSEERTAQLMAYAWPGMSVPVLGFPALGIAATRGEGAPVGVQIIGRPFDEETVLRAGEVIEDRSGIETPIDPVTA